jgi:MarR-like DNA-binding transcriptional regulator SgrR of sgrS sRNA
MPEFKAIVTPDGKIHLRASGFQGSACLEEADRLKHLLAEAGIDVDVESLELTDEYYRVQARAKASERI